MPSSIETHAAFCKTTWKKLHRVYANYIYLNVIFIILIGKLFISLFFGKELSFKSNSLMLSSSELHRAFMCDILSNITQGVHKLYLTLSYFHNIHGNIIYLFIYWKRIVVMAKICACQVLYKFTEPFCKTSRRTLHRVCINYKYNLEI